MHYLWTIVAQQSEEHWVVRNAPVLSFIAAFLSFLAARRSARAAEESAKAAKERDHRERTPTFSLTERSHHAGIGKSLLRLRLETGPRLKDVTFLVNELQEKSRPPYRKRHPGRVLMGKHLVFEGSIGPMALHQEKDIVVQIDSEAREDFSLVLRCIAYNGEEWDCPVKVTK
jgi:hypothetical protein